jgi:hypothetical protein
MKLPVVFSVNVFVSRTYCPVDHMHFSLASAPTHALSCSNAHTSTHEHDRRKISRVPPQSAAQPRHQGGHPHALPYPAAAAADGCIQSRAEASQRRTQHVNAAAAAAATTYARGIMRHHGAPVQQSIRRPAPCSAGHTQPHGVLQLPCQRETGSRDDG